jgi:hypothetical protein
MYSGVSMLVKRYGSYEFNGTYFSFSVTSDGGSYIFNNLEPTMMLGTYTYMTIDYDVVLTPDPSSKKCIAPTVCFVFLGMCFFLCDNKITNIYCLAKIYISTNTITNTSDRGDNGNHQQRHANAANAETFRAAFDNTFQRTTTKCRHSAAGQWCYNKI